MLEKFMRLFSVPILNALPDVFLQRFMKNSSHDAEVVLENVGSARALEVMYGGRNKGLFLRGFFHGLANVFLCKYKSGEPKPLEDTIAVKWVGEDEINNYEFTHDNVKNYIIEAFEYLKLHSWDSTFTN